MDYVFVKRLCYITFLTFELSNFMQKNDEPILRSWVSKSEIDRQTEPNS